MTIVIDIFFYIILSALLSWFFFYWRRRELLGGFIGGCVVALLGAVLGAFLISDILKKVILNLQHGFGIANINLLAALIGGYFNLYIFNRINHDKKRKDY